MGRRAAEPAALACPGRPEPGLSDASLPKKTGVLREYAQPLLVAVALAAVVRLLVVEAFRIPSSSMIPTLHAGDHIFVSKLAYGPLVPLTDHRLVELGAPRRGDVIVFSLPRDPDKDFVKRVVGLPGDVIELREQVVHVNGVPQPRRAAGRITYEERSESGALFRDTCSQWEEELARGDLRTGPAHARAGLAGQGVSRHRVVQCRVARRGEREGPFEVVKPGHVFVLGDNRDRSADSRSDGGWQVPFNHIKGRAELVWWSWGGPRLAAASAGEGLRVERLFKRIE